MDILIKGMEKPRCCGDCRFFKRGHNPFGEDFIFAQPWGDCLVSGEKDVIEHEISEGCPLVALPPHGELISRGGALFQLQAEALGISPNDKDFEGIKKGLLIARKIIIEAPVIVEASNE